LAYQSDALQPEAQPSFEPCGHLALPGIQLSLMLDSDLQPDGIFPTSEQWIDQLNVGVRQIGPTFIRIAKEAGVFDILGIDPMGHTTHIELSWVSNQTIQHLNRTYRHKDAATDVLTFTLLADSAQRAMWLSLPEIQIGSIFVSLPWAEESISKMEPKRTSQTVEQQRFYYLMERVIHGFLHLHGQHHDTMPDFERVVAIQQQVLKEAFGSEVQSSIHLYDDFQPTSASENITQAIAVTWRE
jgi:probable rRNA maturation factor